MHITIMREKSRFILAVTKSFSRTEMHKLDERILMNNDNV